MDPGRKGKARRVALAVTAALVVAGACGVDSADVALQRPAELGAASRAWADQALAVIESEMAAGNVGVQEVLRYAAPHVVLDARVVEHAGRGQAGADGPPRAGMRVDP